MKFKKNYEKSKHEATINTLPSFTQPEHESDLEINSVMARYVATGYLPLKDAAPQFADLSDTMDFDEAQNRILKARALFLDLPLSVKDEFRTADELLKAFHSPIGLKKLELHGLLTKKEPVTQAVEPPAAKAAPAS